MNYWNVFALCILLSSKLIAAESIVSNMRLGADANFETSELNNFIAQDIAIGTADILLDSITLFLSTVDGAKVDICVQLQDLGSQRMVGAFPIVSFEGEARFQPFVPKRDVVLKANTTYRLFVSGSSDDAFVLLTAQTVESTNRFGSTLGDQANGQFHKPKKIFEHVVILDVAGSETST